MYLVSKNDIAEYLKNVKKSIECGKYRIDTNIRRQNNIKLYTDYVIDEKMSKEILLSLSVEDFSEIRDNEHVGREYEKLYIFERKVKLIRRFGKREKLVPLYIKMLLKENGLVIIISFHEEMYPLKHPYK